MRAYSGGAIYLFAGLFLHYMIPFIWKVLYYFVSRRFLPRNYPLLKSICIGLVIWDIMNFVVKPITYARVFHYTARDAITGILILSVAIGLPLSFIMDRNIRCRRVAGH
jgi:hypothetical protein